MRSLLRRVKLSIVNCQLSIMLMLLAALTSCERRELYVYGDEFRSVELEVDWRNYAPSDPGGMTVWFYPLDAKNRVAPYRSTTANVRHHELYVPGGNYQGVVIDYSPEEYSHQEFLDLDSLTKARVEVTPAMYQPDSLIVAGEGVPHGMYRDVNPELFSDVAWTSLHTHRPAVLDNGLYVVGNQPEEMGLDTLNNRYVDRGEYGDYIPWKKSDTYQSSIKITKLFSQPETLIWKMRIRVYIRSGFNYLWQTPASITGLSNGHYLPLDRNTDEPSIHFLENWTLSRTGENSGYIETTLMTFGLRPGSILPTYEHHSATRVGDEEPDYNNPDWYSYNTGLCLPEELRLNLAFVLRDHATTLYYHFNVGHMVVSFDEQLVLRVELGPDWDDPIDLPFVEAYSGTGFDATVTPWEDGGTADTTM